MQFLSPVTLQLTSFDPGVYPRKKQKKKQKKNKKTSATLFQRVQRIQRRCIQSETSLQPKLPSVNSPSICKASDSPNTIYHLYIVEAVRTEGSSPATTAEERQRKTKREKRGDTRRAGPFDLAKLS